MENKIEDNNEMKQALDHKDQADDYRDSKQFDMAIKHYRSAIDLKPDFWEAHANISIIYSGMGRHSEALEHAMESVLIMPEIAQLSDNLGSIYRGSGNYEQAINCHKKALDIDSSMPSAYFNLGLSYEMTGAVEKAIAAYENAIEHNDRLLPAYIALGNLLVNQKRGDNAVDAYQSAINLRPNQPDIHVKLGKVFLDLNRHEDAIVSFNQALEYSANSLVTYHCLAVAQQKLGRFDDEITSYQKALQIKPDCYETHFNLGAAFKECGKIDDSIKTYQRAVELKPDYAEAYTNLGDALRLQDKFDEAAAAILRGLEINPSDATPYALLGMVQVEQNNLDKAVTAYRSAIKIEPDDAGLYIGLGTVLFKKEDYEEAVAVYDKALNINPGCKSSVYLKLSFALRKLDKLDQAITCLRGALRHYPDDIPVLTYLHVMQCQACDWERLGELDKKIDSLIGDRINKQYNDLGNPFGALFRTDDVEQQLFIAKTFSEKITNKIKRMRNNFSFDSRDLSYRKLRIGYLSHDFNNHPVSYVISGIFREHDREKVNVFIYSYGPDDGSERRKTIIQYSDKFVDLSECSDGEAANQIFTDEVDIIVDLMGHTRGSRHEICALRPAPIQVNYLGFPGTTGAGFMDYVLTDRYVTPIEHAPFYSEKFAYLPDTFFPTDDHQEICSKAYTRQDFGLPEDGFVFCCFCSAYKINGLFFNVWIDILNEIDNSVLWLSTPSFCSADMLKKEAQKRGLDVGRIIFAERVPGVDDHLKRIQLADLALDTQIYNGHTTTSDALWAGVPVVTTEGNHFASRVSSSLLNAVGLPELVTTSLENYQSLAIRLASNPLELFEIRQRLDRNRKCGSLFNTKKMTGNLEAAYTSMWERYVNGDKPDHLYM
ncbi:MAG: tetratricopeptide repeat protein [Gammaproteobacteria bacterium]|nr:tetratricopeptide repeat protein [Gammaproteobacteria bacterium]